MISGQGAMPSPRPFKVGLPDTLVARTIDKKGPGEQCRDLAPSLSPSQDEPLPGAGEQMRWSYWQAWSTRAQTGLALMVPQGFEI